MPTFRQISADNRIVPCCRSTHEKGEEVGRPWQWRHPGGETAEDGVQRRTTGQAEEGVRGESIPDRAEEAAALEGSGPERGANQDLVSEQEGEDQEGERAEESARPSADGPGALQSFDGSVDQGGGGTSGRASSEMTTIGSIE